MFVVLKTELDLQFLSTQITSSLKFSGDVELNRGPHEISCDQLSRKVKIFERVANLEILKKNLYDIIAVYGDAFVRDVFTVANVNVSSECILFFYVVMQLSYLDM